MSDELTRFASGEIIGWNLADTNKAGKYGFSMIGYFEDTRDKIQNKDGEMEYYASKWPITIYEGDNSPIDPSEAQRLRFQGRVMFTQKDYEGRTYLFPKAISIEKRLEIIEKSENSYEPESNPFLDNPLR